LKTKRYWHLCLDFKDYYYPNNQPIRTLWYHDHALGITAVNAYFGQAGFYFLHDDETQERVKLPTGDYDIPLMISSKQFLPSGKLLSPEDERVSLFGDVITINAQPWPYFNVEPRKYKFRLLDAAVSRSFNLYLVADSDPKTKLSFTVVGADAGYLDHPVPTQNLIISMAERYEIVIDFDKYKNSNLTLMNERDFQTNTDYPATDRVLRFVVGDKVTNSDNNGDIQPHLSDLAIPTAHPTVDYSFEFERKNGQWLINGVGFEDPANRVIAFPKTGQVSRWRLTNKSGGKFSIWKLRVKYQLNIFIGWSHPIHIHLIDFQVVSRVGSGRKGVEPYEAAALKDVVYLGTNEEVEVLANYAPWSGVYMVSRHFVPHHRATQHSLTVLKFHCHNLVHEDHDMMAAFNVSDVDLTALGYPETTSFGDPMAPVFRAKPYTGTDLYQVKNVLLPYFHNLNAYPNTTAVELALSNYYAAAASSSSVTVPASTVRSTLVTVASSATATPTTTSTSVKTTSTAPATSSSCSKGNGKNTCK
jgi:bilirubin oxidase